MQYMNICIVCVEYNVVVKSRGTFIDEWRSSWILNRKMPTQSSMTLFLVTVHIKKKLKGDWLFCFSVASFFFFWDEFCSCYPGWSAMVRSRLTATSASWVQAILLPQLPEYLGLQACATMPSPVIPFLLFKPSHQEKHRSALRWPFCVRAWFARGKSYKFFPSNGLGVLVAR